MVLWEIITGEKPDKLRGLRAPECAAFLRHSSCYSCTTYNLGHVSTRCPTRCMGCICQSALAPSLSNFKGPFIPRAALARVRLNGLAHAILCCQKFFVIINCPMAPCKRAYLTGVSPRDSAFSMSAVLSCESDLETDLLCLTDGNGCGVPEWARHSR